MRGRNLWLYGSAVACGLVGLVAALDVQAAETPNAPLQIAVLDDMSGIFRDLQGPGDVVAAEMAAEDFGKTVLGKPIEVLSGDLQNKVDVGAALARRWYDEGVTAIFGLGHSGVALAVQDIAREKNRINVAVSGGVTDLTGRACSPNGIAWTYDNYALAKVTAGALTRGGGKTWSLIVSDYAFGHSLEQTARAVVQQNGGTVATSTRVPLGTADFSSALLRSQTPPPDVLGLGTVGSDLANTIKQMKEFGLPGAKMKVAVFVMFTTDVHAVGLDVAQGLRFAEAGYWDENDATRAFAKRFMARVGRPPTSIQASMYGAVMHYLKAVQAAGTTDTAAVMKRMKETKINDFMTKDAYIREDGRVMRDMLLLEVKRPDESKGPWDLLKIVERVPAEQAFRPLSESDCPLVKR